MFVEPGDRLSSSPNPLHALRIIYLARIKGGTLTHEIGGSSDEARWVPLEQVAELPTLSLVSTAIDQLLQRIARERDLRARP